MWGLHLREMDSRVLLKSSQGASVSISVCPYWWIISMTAAFSDEDLLQLIRKQAWADKSTDASAVLRGFFENSQANMSAWK